MNRLCEIAIAAILLFMLGFGAYIHFFIAPNLPEGIFPAGCIR